MKLRFVDSLFHESYFENFFVPNKTWQTKIFREKAVSQKLSQNKIRLPSSTPAVRGCLLLAACCSHPQVLSLPSGTPWPPRASILPTWIFVRLVVLILCVCFFSAISCRVFFSKIVEFAFEIQVISCFFNFSTAEYVVLLEFSLSKTFLVFAARVRAVLHRSKYDLKADKSAQTRSPAITEVSGVLWWQTLAVLNRLTALLSHIRVDQTYSAVFHFLILAYSKSCCFSSLLIIVAVLLSGKRGLRPSVLGRGKRTWPWSQQNQPVRWRHCPRTPPGHIR